MYLRAPVVAAGWLLGLGFYLTACSGGAGNPATSLGRQAAGFNLSVLPETNIDQASHGQFTLVLVPQSAGGQIAEVRVSSARRLRAAYFDLTYDAETYSPSEIVTGPALRGSGSSNTPLVLNITSQAGVVHCGQVVQHCLDAPGFSGDGVVAWLHFAKRPFSQSTRAASTPPDNAESQAAAGFNSGSGELSWRFNNKGDYNQNGQVGLTDLTPLGVRFGQSVAYPAELNTAKAVIDGNNDGILNIGDLTQIGVNYGKDLQDGWNVYRSLNAADYPTNAADNNGTATQFATFPVNGYDASTTPGMDRVLYKFIVASPAPGEYYWVRPVDATGVEGYASDLVSNAGGGNTPPIISNVSISSLTVSSLGVLDLTINATDADGDPLTYSVTPDLGTTGAGDPLPQTYVFYAPAVISDTSVNLTCGVDDGHGGTDSSILPITVLAPVPSNSAPVISSVTVTPNPVQTGSTAALNIAASDPDGDPLTYTWLVLNGTISGSGASVTYNTPSVLVDSSYNLTVFADDGHGHNTQDSSQTITVTVSADQAPIAMMTTTGGNGDGLNGVAPHYVAFDGTGSSDPDGDPITYAWDFNADGIADSTAATGEYIYAGAGIYGASLKVSDGTLTGSDSRSVAVTDPGAWHVTTLAGSSDDSGAFCSLADINGNPAIAYRSNDGINTQLMYMESTNALGSSWFLPATVPGMGPQWISLALVNGSPAIAYYDNGLVVPSLAYSRYDSGSATWGMPVMLDSTIDAGDYCSMLYYGGVPCVSYYQSDGVDGQLRFESAVNSNGDFWALPATIDGGAGINTGKYTSIANINGLVGISYFDAGTASLKFAIATDPFVTSFNTYTVYAAAAHDVGRYSSLTLIAGHPAIAFADITANRVLYIRATDAGGTDWSGSIWVVSEDAGQDLALASISGQPAVAFRKTDGSLEYLRSGTPFAFNQYNGGTIDDVPGQNVGYYVNLKEIGDKPCVAYYNFDAKDLLFAVQYP